MQDTMKLASAYIKSPFIMIQYKRSYKLKKIKYKLLKIDVDFGIIGKY